MDILENLEIANRATLNARIIYLRNEEDADIPPRWAVMSNARKRELIRGFAQVPINPNVISIDIPYENRNLNKWNIGLDTIKRENITGLKKIMVVWTDILDNKYVLVDKVVDIPVGNNAINRWSKELNFRQLFMITSAISVFDAEAVEDILPAPVDRVELVFTNALGVEGMDFAQRFLDGVSHCVFTPIMNDCLEKIENTRGSTKKSYETLKRKCERLSIEYAEGVPINDMQKVCNELKVSMNIVDIQNNKVHSFKAKGKPRFKYKYINTRLNHLEVDKVVNWSNKEVIDITQQGIYELKNQLDEINAFYYFYRNNKHISRINTIDKVYKVCVDYDESVKAMDKLYHVSDHYMKYTVGEENELVEFVRAGVHYNESCVYQEYNENLNHADHKKSYTQFQNCEYYRGFPRVCMFGRVETNEDTRNYLRNHLGYFRISDVNLDKCSETVRTHIEKLNIFYCSVFPSVELEFYWDNNVRFKITHGAIGKSFSFEFPIWMYKKRNKAPYYGLWAGQLDIMSKKYKFYARGEEQWAQHLATNYEHVVYSKDGDIEISIDKTSGYCGSNITGFITAYSRIQVLNKLFSMRVEDVYYVISDGIYYNGDYEFEEEFWHNDKALKEYSSEGYHYEYLSNRENELKLIDDKLGEIHDKFLYCGSGGSGKTHTLLTDKTLNEVLYIAPSQKLCRSKSLEYNVSSCNYNRLVGRCCKSYLVDKIKPKIYCADEGTQYTNENIDKIFELDPHAIVFICGDFNPMTGVIYQLPPVEGEVMDIDGIPFKMFNLDWRSNCIRLHRVKKRLRELIDINADKYTINREFNELLADRLITKDQIVNLYKETDYILCSKHTFVKEWTNMFSEIRPKKWLITKNKGDYLNGDIVYSDEKPSSGELRHAFTVHAIQGETCRTLLFIDKRHLFDARMAYTAVSRATTINDIYLI